MVRFAFVTVPNWILGTLMLAGVAINFANVVARYAFGRPFFWAEEVLVFLTMWGVFIGLAAVSYRGNHLKMDLVSATLPAPAQRVLDGLVAAVLVACCAFVIAQSYQVVALFARTGQVSVAAGIPKAIPHAALLAGFALAALAVLVRIRADSCRKS